MRILYISDSYRPSRSACANRACVLAEALLDAGHDVRVLASSDSLIDADSDYKAPDYVTFFQTFPLKEKTLKNRLKNNFGGLVESFKMAKSMGSFDIVICTTPPLLIAIAAMKVAKRLNARFVLDVRDIWPDVAYEMGAFTPRSLYGKFFERVARNAYRMADFVVSVSPGKVEKLRKRVSANCADRVLLVPNGIDESFIELDSDERVIERFALDDGRKACVYIGNVGLAQGLDSLLAIAENRRDVRFLIFGTGADRAKLEAKAERKGLENVEFCGIIGPSEVKSVLENAAASYIPLVSSKLSDSIPTKLYEALACGCPVVLAAAGDSVRILEESGLGTAVAPERQECLLRVFSKVIDSDWSDAQRGRARSYVAENHLRQQFAKTFVDAIETLDERAPVAY